MRLDRPGVSIHLHHVWFLSVLLVLNGCPKLDDTEAELEGDWRLNFMQGDLTMISTHEQTLISSNEPGTGEILVQGDIELRLKYFRFVDLGWQTFSIQLYDAISLWGGIHLTIRHPLDSISPASLRWVDSQNHVKTFEGELSLHLDLETLELVITESTLISAQDESVTVFGSLRPLRFSVPDGEQTLVPGMQGYTLADSGRLLLDSNGDFEMSFKYLGEMNFNSQGYWSADENQLYLFMVDPDEDVVYDSSQFDYDIQGDELLLWDTAPACPELVPSCWQQYEVGFGMFPGSLEALDWNLFWRYDRE